LSYKGADGNESRSRWRETAFVFRELRRAICPAAGLAKTMRDWPSISAALAEGPRKRRLQTPEIESVLEASLG
jgi:hypothetical protein